MFVAAADGNHPITAQPAKELHEDTDRSSTESR
jgi:hypothetical protein